MRFTALVKTAFIFLFIILFVACGFFENEKETLLEKKLFDLESTDGAKRIEGDAHSGKYFSRADSVDVYGVGTIYTIPDSLINKTIRVKFNGWVRLGDYKSDKKYAFSLEDGKNTIMEWVQLDFRDYIDEPNEWVHVEDDVLFPAVFIEKPGMIIKTYSYNSSGKSTLDCDDVELSFFKVEKLKK